jgi:hypothetical protein
MFVVFHLFVFVKRYTIEWYKRYSFLPNKNETD